MSTRIASTRALDAGGMSVNDGIANVESDGGFRRPPEKPFLGPEGRPCMPRAPSRAGALARSAAWAIVSLLMAASNSGWSFFVRIGSGTRWEYIC